LASAGATLYGALAVVPTLLVAVAVAQLWLGRTDVERFGARLADNLPDAMGAGTATRSLLHAGLTLTPVGVLLAVLMASAYGDGLSRALLRFAPASSSAKPPAWWLRAATLPALGLAPLLLTCLLVTAPWIATISGGDQLPGAALATYVSLNVVWVLTWVPLTWAFQVVGPGRVSWRSTLLGALVTGAFVSGFLHGFLVFLALPVDLGRPFGGLAGAGMVSALLLWLWLLHAVVCVGYAFTWAVETQLRSDQESIGAAHAPAPTPPHGLTRSRDG
jgi:membrane protein